ncbi:F-box protein SKIP23-like [Typha latifolia]|uniref:F-box protein SKIP23-like n=1 Tax=Typha latifolia TaxID=4733 RepID=UPI003C2FCB95
MADWSGLPADLLITIVERLSIPEYFVFSGVCVSWRLASRKVIHLNVRPKPQSPWLMVPGGTEDTASFFSLSDGKLRSIPLPEPKIRSRVCMGSSDGWLVTHDEACEVHLLNPITREQIALPPLSTFYFVEKTASGFLVDDVTFLRDQGTTDYGVDSEGKRTPPMALSLEEMRRYMFQKAVLIVNGSEFTVFLIHEPGSSLSFVRAGDKGWTCLISVEGIMDIIHHEGRVYTVTTSGIVEAWDPDGFSSFKRRAIMTLPPHYDAEDFYFKSLVASPAGELMLVLREMGEYEGTESTTGFRVVLLDERKLEWTELTNIGEVAIFTGLNRSMCLSSSEFPELRGNCVYFTEGLSDIMDEHDEKRDVGIFDLKERSVVPLESGGPHLRWPPPIWLTPSLS